MGGDRERCYGHLTHLLKPMSTLLSLAVLIGCTNQVEGSSTVFGANTLRVTNILLLEGDGRPWPCHLRTPPALDMPARNDLHIKSLQRSIN